MRAHRRFASDERGVSAIEFAIVAPFMVLLYLGLCDMTLALNFNQKLKSTTVAINDLVGQNFSVTRADVEETFVIARPMLGIETMDGLSVRTSALRIDAAGNPTVVWSVAMAGDAITVPIDELPDDLIAVPGDEFIVTSSSYAYHPVLARLLPSEIALSSTIHGRARGRQGVVCENC